MERWGSRVLLTVLLFSGTLIVCKDPMIHNKRNVTPFKSSAVFSYNILAITAAQRDELLETVQAAERMVQQAVSSVKPQKVKGRRVYVFSDFISKKQLYDYYAQMWSDSLATQLTYETSDLNYSIPGVGLAIHPSFYQISILTMKKPQVRITSYLHHMATLECSGQVASGETYCIRYTLMKKKDSSHWLVAHKVVTHGKDDQNYDQKRQQQ